jgi:branched-subunit amino acid transport protein
MTWTLVLLLAAGAYGFKVLGLVVIGDRQLPPVLERCVALIPVALLPALIVSGTFSVGHHLQIDARAAGVGAAILAAWRRAPLALVIVTGVIVTAAVRAVA